MKYTQETFLQQRPTLKGKRLPVSFIVGERKSLPLPPPLGFLYHTRGKKIVNRGQGFKKIDWEQCNQENAKPLRNTYKGFSLETQAY